MFNCFDKASYQGFEVHIVKYPLNNEAPFSFNLNKNISFYEKDDYPSQYHLIDLIDQIKPGAIFISGWIDKEYLKAIKNSLLSSKKILMIDTPWNGNIKQTLWSIYFKFCKKKFFDSIWVPGSPQVKYALKLGFKKEEVFNGIYTCNDDIFNKKKHEIKARNNPRKFIFIGRYIKEKGIEELCNNFIELNSKQDDKWELWCIGNGKLWNSRIQNKFIKHFGFIQPDALTGIISKSDAYILPSNYEPWGVSLHEMVSMGKPVLVSENVGSSYCFAKNGINGFVFSHKKENDFKIKMKKMMQLSDEDFDQMGKESVHLSKAFSSDKWIKTLKEIYD